jgi:lysophospholipase L1-like esterase/glyoxylase-like metal-dependent hydrolase (beta-lactamase superfamily II)
MRKLQRFAYALSCLSLGAIHAYSATNDVPAATKPDARAVFAASERVLALPASARAVALTMQGVYFARDQASRPEIAVVEVPDRQSVLLTRDGRYRLESDTVFPGAIRFHYLTIGSPTTRESVDLLRWRDGNEIDRAQPPAGADEFSDLQLLAPGLLLADARTRTPRLAVDDASGDVRVTFLDRAGRTSVITIDPTTKLVKAATVGNEHYVYEDYRQGGDALQPQRISIYRDSRLRSRWERASVAAANVDARAFELPAGYVAKTGRGPLRATALGNGAWRIDGSPSGYHTGFVVGAEAVAVFDAPISRAEAVKVREVIERTAPGRRLAYVVTSHTHSDHVAGLPAYLDAGAKALTGRGGSIALRRQFADMRDSAVEEVTQPRTLDLGGKTVVVRPLASSHAAEMLVSYAPDSRALFQGDLFYLPEAGVTPATFEGGEELSRLIAREKLDVDVIVGVHGRSGNLVDLAEGVKRRREAPQWVSAWSAAPDQEGPPLTGKTIRQVVRPSIGGSLVRLRFSNLYGSAAVTIGPVRIAKHAGESAIQPQTDRAMTFGGGKRTVTIAQGADVLSDPVALPVMALEQLAISLYVVDSGKATTWHGVGMQTAYIASGDLTAAAKLAGSETDTSRYILTDVEVAGRADARTIVVIGDSITDGVGSANDANRRWPDALADRLRADPTLASVAVVNSGIAGNRLLNDASEPFVGPSLLSRFERDALSKPGVRWIILLSGSNDISASDMLDSPKDKVSAQQIIAGMKQLIERAHARGVKVYGATVLPKAGVRKPFIHTPQAQAKRNEVNAWIRDSGAFDAVVDFERLMCDPARPDHLSPAYDSGDHLHPNEAGFKAMAEAIDLELFRE